MPLSEQQHRNRSQGIGASEAYIACGFTSFGRTPVRLWSEKTGRSKRQTLDDLPDEAREGIDVGIDIEDFIAEQYTKKTGIRLRRAAQNRSYVSKENPFMLCHVDRLVEGRKRERLVECKNVRDIVYDRGEWGDPGTDEVPLGYYFQCQHMLECTGRKIVDVAAFIGGNRLRIYHVERDDKIQQMMVNLERAFWDCVETDTAPKPLNAQDISLLYPSEDDVLPPLIADLELHQLVQKCRLNKYQAKKYGDVADEQVLELKRRMEKSGVLIDMHGMELATFRQNKSGTKTDYKAMCDRLFLELSGLPGRASQPRYNDEWRDHIVALFTEDKPGNRPLNLKAGEKAYVI